MCGLEFVPRLCSVTIRWAESLNLHLLPPQVLDAFKSLIDSGKYPQWTLEEFNHEGWRVSIDEGLGDRKGWLLMRQSLHDPLLVLNVESEVKGGVAAQCKIMVEFLASGPMLDLTSLEKAATSCDI